MKLNDDEKAILYRALVRHVNSLEKSVAGCVGGLYPAIYQGEADRAKKLFEKVTGGKFPEKK